MKPVFCFCNSNRTWGGGEKWHLEAALATAARGAKVYLVAGRDTPLFLRAKEHPQLTAIAARFSGLDFLNPFILRHWANFFKNAGVNRLILGLPADLKAAGLAAHFANVPGIYYRRGSALPVRNSALNRFLYRRVLTGLIVNSRETARLVFAANPDLIPKNRLHILTNGIDLPVFDQVLQKAAPIFRRPGDDPALPLIGNAGRLTAQKGQQFLLHMSRHLHANGYPHRLILAGDGEKAAELAELAKRLGVADSVHFAGFQADMAPFWRSIDIFVLSSLWEGFGYVLAEAMLAEKPVMAFDCNSMPELVHPDRTGVLLPPPSAGESDDAVGKRMADSLLRLAQDPERMRRLAQGGREFCRDTCDQAKVMDKLFTLLWPKDDACSPQ